MMKLLTRIRYVVKHTRIFSTKMDGILKSKLPDVVIPEVPVHEHIFKNISRWHDKVAVICQQTGRSYTYDELRKRSKAVAHFFKRRLKLQKGSIIAIIMPNVPEYPIFLLATSQAGLQATTVNPLFNIEEMAKQLARSETKAVVTSTIAWSTVSKAVQQDVPVVIVRHEKHHLIPQGTIDFNEISNSDSTDLESVDIKDTFVLPYSSGTTGLPKGVELTHKNIVANLAQIAVPEIRLHVEAEGNTQDVVPIFVPIFHIYGMATVMLAMLSGGCKMITVPKFGTNEFLQILDEYKPTVVNIVPPVVHLINNNPEFTSERLESLRIVMCGAAPIGPSDVQRFKEKTKGKVALVQGYGMTETSPVVTFQSAVMENGTKDGGIGLIVPNTECKVVATDDPHGKALGPNKSGELYVRGPQVMKGYYKNKAATEEIITEDGFLKTGDIVYFDDDEHFYLTDRLKELIKVKGFQVAPAELEIILRQHPEVVDCAVVGVAHPIMGEAPKAFVVKRNGSSVTADEIKGYVASKVTSYKNLNGGVDFIESIPRNPSGKILRKELKNL